MAQTRAQTSERTAGGPPEGAPTPYLLLDVAGTPCALPGAAVDEILPLPDLHAPPASGGWLAGFLDLGGRPVPVLDLAALLGLRPAGAEPGHREFGLHAHLVLTGGRALLVDRAEDLLAVAPGALTPVAAGGSLNGCVAGEIRYGDRLVHALDPARLLGAEEQARLRALEAAARARLAGLPRERAGERPRELADGSPAA